MSHIRLKTEIPGPRARDMLARRERAVTKALARATDVVVAKAEGSVIEDVDGNRFIDFVGGIGMLAVGHCPPPVVAAIQDQAARLVHTCALVATYEPYVRLCELLNEIAPGEGPKKTLLANSGAESVENAVKIARSFTGRPAVITFEGAYHGRTLLTLSLTSKYGLFKKGFGPFAPEIYRLPVPYLYRSPAGMSEEGYLDWSIRQLENALVAHVDPSAVAAIIIEPVQGEAGFVPVPFRFLCRIRDLCDEHGIVMIADEVQSGMGRTGRMFAIEHAGIVPDLLVTAKSLGGGMPISAVTGKATIMDHPHPGGVGGTFGGSPVACAAALEAVEMIRQPEFLERARSMGRLIREELERWKDEIPLIGDVRGLGPMLLLELVRDRASRDPIPKETLDVVRTAASRGLITMRAGLYSNCIRLLPPLNTPEDILLEGLDVLHESLRSVAASGV